MYDLEKLLTELPTHPRQIGIKYLHELKARKYWAKRNRETMTPPPEEPIAWVTVVQAVQRFNVSDGTIRRWVKEHNIPTQKVKGRVMIDLDELYAFHEMWNGYQNTRRKAG